MRASPDLHLTEEQEEYLERQFQKSKNPHPSEMMLLAAETGLLEEEVQVSRFKFNPDLSL